MAGEVGDCGRCVVQAGHCPLRHGQRLLEPDGLLARGVEHASRLVTFRPIRRTWVRASISSVTAWRHGSVVDGSAPTAAARAASATYR